jgi:low affinity Fe/Cu permease
MGRRMGPRERTAWFRLGHHGAWPSSLGRCCEALAGWTTRWAGSTTAFVSACLFIAVWLAVGPLFRYSDTWQLVANTFTTLAEFVMMFVLQRAVNKDGLATQLKLNELLASKRGSSNLLLNVEDMTEDEIRVLAERYRRLAEIAKADPDTRAAHSVEEVPRVEE